MHLYIKSLLDTQSDYLRENNMFFVSTLLHHLFIAVISIISFTAMIEYVSAMNLATLHPDGFAEFYNILPVPIWITSDTGQVIFLNEKWTDFTGSNSFDWLSFLHPDDYAETIAKRQVSFEKGRLFEHKYRLRSSHGDYQWFVVRATPILDENKTIVRWFGASTSIHERMLQEAQVQKEEQQRNSFIANIHHDCLTPLAGSIGMLELVLAQLEYYTKDLKPKTHHRYNSSPIYGSRVDRYISQDQILHIQADLQTALRCNNDLQTLIENILDISRLRAGKITLEDNQFDLNIAIDNAIKDITSQNAHKKIDFQPNEEINNWIYGDHKRYTQIITNLLSNAVKYTNKDQTTITIKVELRPDRNLVTCIDDNGIGMTELEIERAFEAFEQADTTTCRTTGGSGLGLTLCKSLAELMNGHIEINSKKNVGTQVCVTIPYRIKSDLVVPSFVRRPSEGNVRTKTLLIVEDDKVLSRIMVKTLNNHYNLLVVDDGVPAVNTFSENHNIDLILMDCNLKVMDGFCATREIRRIEYEQKRTVIPIVAVTASATDNDQVRIRASGMTDVIAKPYRPKEILDRIKKMLP